MSYAPPPPSVISLSLSTLCGVCETGLDYVSHEDVLPYTSTGLETFNHDLFEQFFIPSGSEEGWHQA